MTLDRTKAIKTKYKNINFSSKDGLKSKIIMLQKNISELTDTVKKLTETNSQWAYVTRIWKNLFFIIKRTT